MAVHTQDVRRRTDEMNREYIATAGGAALADGKNDLRGTAHLLHLLERSAQSLRHASENVENRGLKLLLKVMAQERVAMVNSLRQSVGGRIDDPLDPANKSAGTSLQQGLQDIQTSMTVQKQGRENVALTHLLDEEGELLAAYTAASEGSSSSPLRDLLESQRSQIAQFHTRLQGADFGVEPIIARIFDTRIEGDSAVTRLRSAGLDGSQIDIAPITQVAAPVMRSASTTASPKSTIVAGAFSGAIIGAIIGFALAAYVWNAPQLVGWVTVGPWALIIGAMLFATFFGSVIGFFIGQNRREDDLAVTADSLVNGEILVVAYPQPHQLAMAEDVLQVHHARELNR